jgi:hypothetical protein
MKGPCGPLLVIRKKILAISADLRVNTVKCLMSFYVDGNLTNNRLANLKTVCANCQRYLHKDGVRWKQGDLRPDF